nr:FadR/GntR family transcriptional regulator [Micromonospora sp. DSM 115978]
SIQLAPMDVPKASDVLANELRERILSGEFTEGTPLPPERELVVQTKMSRATVREALRILEAQGLLRIKAGRAGGAFVRHPGQDSVATSVGMLIRGQRIRFTDLLETREAIEPSCARLAARNRTATDLEILDEANRAIAVSQSLDEFLLANVDWHVAVAAATHNEILTGMMTALSRAIYTATNNEQFIDAAIQEVTAKAHRSITQAIRDQDPAAAVRRMSRHMHAYADAALAVEQRTEISVPADV